MVWTGRSGAGSCTVDDVGVGNGAEVVVVAGLGVVVLEELVVVGGRVVEVVGGGGGAEVVMGVATLGAVVTVGSPPQKVEIPRSPQT